MRQNTMLGPDAGAVTGGEAPSTPQGATAQTQAATAGAASPTASSTGVLTALLALEEPARTEALEKAVNSGLTVYLQSTTGEEVRQRYGDHVLVVPPTPKPFAAPHAIHLLCYSRGRVERWRGRSWLSRPR